MKLKNMFENYLLNFYFFKVHISVIIEGPYLKFRIRIASIALERTVPQIFHVALG